MSVPDLVAGTIVGQKYSIKALLGRTPVAATYHALTTPNREVALKLFDTALWSHPDVVIALQRTAVAARELPNHVAMELLDEGVDEELGAAFSVTELCATPPLAQLVSLCPLAPPEGVTLVKKLGAALDLAHASGLFHLDLKPTNVFVGPPPHYAVRLSDFAAGLRTGAKRTAASLAWAAPWLAPEQLDDAVAGDARTDVFAMALVAFFALTGHSYWRSCEAAVDVAAWKAEVLAPRVPASTRARECRVSLVAGLDAVFERALDPDPARRFATPGELATALASAVAGNVQAPHVSADWEVPPSLRMATVPPRPSMHAALSMSEAPLASTPESPEPRASTGSGGLDTPAVDTSSRRRPLIVGGAALAVVVCGGALVALLSRGVGARGTATQAPPPSEARASATASASPLPAKAEPPAASIVAPPLAAASPPGQSAEGVGDVGSLEISCTPACVTVLIDMEPANISNGPIRLPAGHHVVAVVAANGRRKLLSINLKAGRAEQMIFQLGKGAR